MQRRRKMNNLFDNLQFKVYTDILKKSKKDGKRLIRGYASTAALDRQNEVITMEALRQAADHLLENHTVFYEHEHQKFPVGKVIETGIDDKGLEVVVEISQTADQLWTLIEEDILDSFSIGGRVTSSEEKVGKDNKPYNEVTGIELFEVSVVGLPANPEAKFALVNKSFNMAITDEIRKRKEGKKMEEKKKIEITSSDTTTTNITVSDGTSNIAEIIEPKAEEKKVVDKKAEKKEEPKKVEKKEDTTVVEKKEDVQKKDLEKYEKEDKKAAEKTDKEKTGEQKETTEDKKQVKIEKGEVKEEKSDEVVVEEKPAEEKVEEEPEIKSDNSVVTDEEFEKLDVIDISKPYPNEHSARIRKPDDFQEGSFRSKPITEGVRIIIGRLKGETKATTQAYRFHVDHFTAEEAKQWLKDHDISYILFEPAKKSEELEEKPEEKSESEEKIEEKKEEEVEGDDESAWESLVDEIENAKEYPYPYAKLGEEVKEIIFLLDKLIAKETNEDAKAIMQQIKAKVSKLVGQAYPYPEKYPYPKKEGEAGKQYPAPEAALKEILAGLKDLGKKIDEVLSRLPEKDVEVKEPEEIKEEPKAEEKKEEPKVEKEVEEKKEEKPQRKSFIADAPYADDKKKAEEKKDVKKTTDKGWSRIVYGN